MHELPLIPLERLWFVFHFIGVDQDRSKIAAVIHASGAISVFIFGIVYLRSRRVDEISAMFENQYDFSEDEEQYDISGNTPRIAQLQALNQKNEDDSSFEEEENENDYLVWRIYDKIIAAVTSQFIVLNICRIGLCFWVLRYN